ncbi:unnamed protein product, partial [Rotaria sp. Silwood1]
TDLVFHGVSSGGMLLPIYIILTAILIYESIIEKINSLPMEMKAMSFEKIIPVQKINKQETIISTNGRIGDPLTSNEYANRNLLTASNQTTTITSPLVILPTQIYKPSIIFPPPIANQCQSSPNTISSSTILLMDQMKTLSISSTSIPPITSSRLVSIVSYLGEYEIVDTSAQFIKIKPMSNIASFPP